MLSLIEDFSTPFHCGRNDECKFTKIVLKTNKKYSFFVLKFLLFLQV